jgi:hypothetical protein
MRWLATTLQIHQHANLAQQVKATISTHSPSAQLFYAFRPPEPAHYREVDIVDTFQSCEYRDSCDMSSLDLHAPFGLLCLQRKQMLTAISSVGRGRGGGELDSTRHTCHEAICDGFQRRTYVRYWADSRKSLLSGIR